MNIINNLDNRSPVISLNGICASSQPLASQVGIDILKQKGNAADAAVAMASVLNLTQPCSTGIGGDCFVLYWDSKTKTIHGINGSGRAPLNLTLDLVRERNITGESLPPYSPLSVTVPGAAAAWCDTIERFGSGNLSMLEVLQPAIDYCEQGIPIQAKTAVIWQAAAHQLENSPNGSELKIDGKSTPKVGDIFKNPNLANTFRLLGKEGKDGFYRGAVAEAIIDILNEMGGVMTHSDLQSHTSTFDKPISISYHGYDIYEMPPNGQGITALLALNILEGFELNKLDPMSVEHSHLLIEALRLAFSDTRYYVADPAFYDVPLERLLSKEYAAERRSLIDQIKCNRGIEKGYPANSSNTVYLSVVDKDGNACSFINSNYMNFGTGIVPKGFGFTLHNRGANFALDEKHPNCLAPGKRPYHTIIPGMIVKDGELYSSFGIMGKFMQPQAHVQTVVNLINHKMDPQTAMSHPRFMIDGGTANGTIMIESGLKNIIEPLIKLGHKVCEKPVEKNERDVFGNGQVIIIDKNNQGKRILIAGSDTRCDGVALGY